MSTVNWQERWMGMPPELKNILVLARKAPKLRVVSGGTIHTEMTAVELWKERVEVHRKLVEYRTQKYLNHAGWLVRRGKMKGSTYDKVVFYTSTRIPDILKAAIKMQEEVLRTNKLATRCQGFAATIKALKIPRVRKTGDDDHEEQYNPKDVLDRNEVLVTTRQYCHMFDKVSQREAVIYPCTPVSRLGHLLPDDDQWLPIIKDWLKI